MHKHDKIILMFYAILGISFFGVLIYVDSTLDKTNLPDILPKEITEIIITRTILVDKDSLFSTFSDVEKYPSILPKNVLNTEIINKTKNTIVEKSIIMEQGIKTTLIVKHHFEPHTIHTIEVMDGDAKGTIIEQVFDGNSTETHLKTKINFKLKGLLSSFLFLPKSNIIHAMNTVIDEFVYYNQISNQKYEKMVDDIYRKVLYRSADPEGLKYFSTLLQEEKITLEEIRQLLLTSDEAKKLLKPDELKEINELSPQTVNTINDLYQKFLFRSADNTGLRHYGSLLENGKLSSKEMEQIFMQSNERKSYEKGILKQKVGIFFSIKNSNYLPFINEFNTLDYSDIKYFSELDPKTINHVNMTFNTILKKPADEYNIRYFSSLLESQKISNNDLPTYLKSSLVN